eukprot:TRINITY_DN19822_c0_g1_i1.p1 TRINITY_DN19822_c0_g1~~TRINITY_DN19822_c0_g1_i1.p1  ORF type:complete len:363 (+),score=72.24 TRINITY_DN19822_c0_g1_i1:247-1335(+)
MGKRHERTKRGASSASKGAKHITVPRASRPPWLSFEGHGNDTVPPDQWSVSLDQFHGFIAACKATSTWTALAARGTPITMYTLSEHFVIPWTMGTGNSVALLLNPTEPRTAQLMISHAWGEDVDQCASALMLHCEANSLWEQTACWFCVFALYQPGDGPTIQEQVDANPFATVISRLKSDDLAIGMLVLHTSTAEPYERLWCAFEIHKALVEGVPLFAASSYDYLKELTGYEGERASLVCNTAAAQCSVVADAETLKTLIVEELGSFEELDATIIAFRMDMSNMMGLELRPDGWHAQANARFYRNSKDAVIRLEELHARTLKVMEETSEPRVNGRVATLVSQGQVLPNMLQRSSSVMVHRTA